ncbi:MAG TPA: AMP-binding protein [Mycobacteriales bacterium]|jgi:fatty-acyl-CoA synthase|nr:AMP-binding protein [Mycobacteriales bacterium]
MVVDRLTSLAGGVARGGWATAKVVHRLGFLTPVRPDRMVGVVAALRHWGRNPAGMYAANAARDPDGIAVIDERESLTFAEIDRRSSVVAAALAERGVASGDAVALLARNSSAFIVSMVAVAKLGADLLYANTGFAGPQLAEVLDSENAAAVIADDEFEDIVEEHRGDRPRVWAWTSGDVVRADSIAGLVGAHGEAPAPELPSPGREGRHVILTSGTTGRPKGASRGSPSALSSAVSGIAMLDAIPYRAGGVTVLAAPAFHAWGWGNVTIAMLMRSTLVMRRRFDPAAALALVEEHGADTLAAVPVMCQRMLDVDADYDTSSLRIVALSGSALAPTLATRFMDRFGDVLYSLYGSTEIAYVSVAGPADLREAPTTAGRVLRGVSVRIVDDDNRDVPPGEVGRIFAGSGMSFEGYTSGEDKARLGTLASIGDLGRIGEDGRLYVEGRDDDMIVSGGENVFPAEIEDVLHKHAAVSDVVVVGVEDERFGQALVAHVVLRDGRSATADDLRAHVKKQLANYKVPREIVFHDSLPRNETGKVLRRELKPTAPAREG